MEWAEEDFITLSKGMMVDINSYVWVIEKSLFFDGFKFLNLMSFEIIKWKRDVRKEWELDTETVNTESGTLNLL